MVNYMHKRLMYRFADYYWTKERVENAGAVLLQIASYFSNCLTYLNALKCIYCVRLWVFQLLWFTQYYFSAVSLDRSGLALVASS